MQKEKRRRGPEESRTRIVFDLADELSDQELRSFEEKAKESGQELKEFFLNLTLRLPPSAA